MEKIRFIEAVLGKNDIPGEVFLTVVLGFSEAFRHFLIAHFHRFRLGINCTVWQHTVHLAFIITDDCDLVLKGHIPQL